MDAAIQEEFATGIDDDFPARSHYLFEDYTLDDVMRSSTIIKKYWLQSVESARLYAQPLSEDGTPVPYAGNRRHLQSWMAGQTF